MNNLFQTRFYIRKTKVIKTQSNKFNLFSRQKEMLVMTMLKEMLDLFSGSLKGCGGI